MVSIIVGGEYLDLYMDNDITFEWTSFIFSSTVKEPYSTDFKVPMTDKNTRLLGITNLTDEVDFDFQEDWVKGILICDEQPKGVDIQIIGVTGDEIELFFVESNPTVEFLSKNLVKKYDSDENGILIDNNSTIYPWYMGSIVDQPTLFIKYDYGEYYNPMCAQLHPSRNFSSVLNSAMSPYGLNIEGMFANTDYANRIYLTANNKYVCPQNRWQIIRGTLNENMGVYVYGGQHVCNDIDTTADKEKTEFTINRACKIRGKMTISFYTKEYDIANARFILRNLTTGEQTWAYLLPTMDYRTYTVTLDLDISFTKGYYTFIVEGAYTDNKFSFFWLGEVYDYNTNEDDLGTELQYKAEYGVPTIYSDKNGYIVTEFRLRYGSGNKPYYEYDSFNYKRDKNAPVVHGEFDKRYYSYFGYYCNLPEISVRDLIYNISWMSNRKTDFSKFQVISFLPFRVYTPIDGEYSIERTDFTDERFGRTTCFLCEGEDIEDVADSDTFTIKNRWLEERTAVKKSMLARLREGVGRVAVIPQYSDFETENLEYDAKFTEVDGFCMTVYNPDKGHLEPVDYFIPTGTGSRRVHIPRLYLDTIKQIYKVEVRIYNSVDMSKFDFLDINGRLYYIVNGDNNLDVPYMTVRGLLINNTEPFLFDTNGEIVTYQ